jgi:predicted nucleotidyltransferase
MEKSPTQKPQSEKKKLRTDKLFDATDIEGKKNKLVFEICERVNGECSKSQEFIGVFPFGSQTKGYNNGESDIDIYVLKEESSESADTNNVSKVLENIKKEYKEKNVNVNFFDDKFGDMELRNFSNVNLTTGTFVGWSALLWSKGRGPKIEYWRNKIKEEINKLPEEQKEEKVTAIVSSLMRRDRHSFPKMEERTAEFDERLWLDGRRKMWESRVRKMIFQT